MKIGDRCFVHGYVDEIRNDVVIIRNSGGYFGTPKKEVIVVYNDKVHPNWISTANKLPDKNEDVLLYHIRYGVTIGFLSRGNHWYIGGIDDIQDGDTVIAWMPLPEPPEEYEE